MKQPKTTTTTHRLVAILACAATAVAIVPVGSAEEGVIYVDPATISFVPTPVIAWAFAPTDGHICAGKGAINTGLHPANESVSVSVENGVCAITSATVRWTSDGKGYAASLDPMTGALSRIREVPADTVNAPTASPSTGTRTSGSVCTNCANPCTWYYTSHTEAEMTEGWTGGYELVKANYNWCVSYTGAYWTMAAYGSCAPTSPWVLDSCTGLYGTGYMLTRGDFHKGSTNTYYHRIDAADYVVGSDHRSTYGECTPSGDLPWYASVKCWNGAGNV